eukprot:TRINITY_DN70012_c0_g1_i1.p1 TRINITY_DN70012_c0_g1~~TRINITY_DN70012_c0_g1_i1.p1  ORF type:complete len:379 (+),score=79.86 TRINITY_DN70012_c0_g1_i1:95-1231(+)
MAMAAVPATFVEPLASKSAFAGQALSAIIGETLTDRQVDEAFDSEHGASPGDLRTCLRIAASLLEQDSKHEAHDFLSAVLQADVPAELLLHLENLEFEVQKDAVRFFSALLRPGADGLLAQELVEYMLCHGSLLEFLLEGCARPEVTMHCHEMLRELTCSPEIVNFMLESSVAFRLMSCASHELFDIASDSFASLRELLLRHKKVSAPYIKIHFDDFFKQFHGGFFNMEADYVTKRQALSLLGEMLLDPNFSKVMQRYASNPEFMKIVMNLLRDQSTLIKVGAFHLFKIFVANPDKPTKIQKILCRNRTRLLDVLTGPGSFIAELATEVWEDQTLQTDLQAVKQILQAMELKPMLGKGERSESGSFLEESCISPRGGA